MEQLLRPTASVATVQRQHQQPQQTRQLLAVVQTYRTVCQATVDIQLTVNHVNNHSTNDEKCHQTSGWHYSSLSTYGREHSALLSKVTFFIQHNSCISYTLECSKCSTYHFPIMDGCVICIWTLETAKATTPVLLQRSAKIYDANNVYTTTFIALLVVVRVNRALVSLAKLANQQHCYSVWIHVQFHHYHASLSANDNSQRIPLLYTNCYICIDDHHCTTIKSTTWCYSTVMLKIYIFLMMIAKIQLGDDAAACQCDYSASAAAATKSTHLSPFVSRFRIDLNQCHNLSSVCLFCPLSTNPLLSILFIISLHLFAAIVLVLIYATCRQRLQPPQQNFLSNYQRKLCDSELIFNPKFIHLFRANINQPKCLIITTVDHWLSWLVRLLNVSLVSKWGQLMQNKNSYLQVILLLYLSMVSFCQANVVSVSSSIASQPEHKTYPDLSTLLGSTVQLPCDLSPPGQLEPVIEEDKSDSDDLSPKIVPESTSVSQTFAADAIQLILWYHGEDISGSPFYSVDARSLQPSSAGHINGSGEDQLKHFVMPQYNERISFDLKPNPALLTIHSVVEEDAGVYWCRVDYRWTRTTISRIALNVLVPPKHVSIYRLMPEDRRAYEAQSMLVNSGDGSGGGGGSSLVIHNSNRTFLTFRTDNRSSSSSSYSISSELANSVLTLDEGIDALIACEAFGGNPLSSISWYRNNRKYSPNMVMVRSDVNRTEAGGDNPTDSVLNLILIRAPSRADIGTIMRCQASNTDLLKPMIRLIKLDVNLKPAKAHIIDVRRDTLTAGSTVHATCLTWGSRPSATIRWSFDYRPLTDVKETVFESNSTTKSTVRFILGSSDNGKNLRCIAENGPLKQTAEKLASVLSGSNDVHHWTPPVNKGPNDDPKDTADDSIPATYSAHDQITLMVKFLPNVTIEVESVGVGGRDSTGSVPNTYSVNSGQTVKIHCRIDANPDPFKIRWLQNRKELFRGMNQDFEFVAANRTLVLNDAKRQHDGKYQCVAYNTLGRGDSKEVTVSVFRAPRCDLTATATIESSLQYPANLFCQVDANPVDNLNIYWQTPHSILLSRNGKLTRIDEDKLGKYENDLDRFDLESDDRIKSSNGFNRMVIASKGSRSRLTVVPNSPDDFGLYRCWAENSVGSNRAEPCLFNLTNNQQYSLPDPVYNCHVNYTLKLLTFRCDHRMSNRTGLFSKSDHHLQFHLILNELDPEGTLRRFTVANKTNPLEPVFVVNNCKPNTMYQATLFVSNLFGQSEQVTMLIETSNSANLSISLMGKSPSVQWPSGYDLNEIWDESIDHRENGSIRKMNKNDSAAEEEEEVVNVERDHNDSSGQSISKPDLQKQNRLEDVSGSHRLLVMLITIFSIALIVFSVLLSVAIVLCVVKRNRRAAHQPQDTSAGGGRNCPDKMDLINKQQQINLNSIVDNKANDYGEETNRATSDAASLVVFGSLPATVHNSPLAASRTQQQQPIYRDFVSLAADPEPYPGGSSITTLDANSIAGVHQPATATFEPKFLCQPNHVSILNGLNAEFITEQGNVQLVTPVVSTAAAYSNIVYPSYIGGSQVQYSPFHISLAVARPSPPPPPLPPPINTNQTLFLEAAGAVSNNTASSTFQSQPIDSSFSLSETSLLSESAARVSKQQQYNPTIQVDPAAATDESNLIHTTAV